MSETTAFHYSLKLLHSHGAPALVFSLPLPDLCSSQDCVGIFPVLLFHLFSLGNLKALSFWSVAVQ